MKTKLLLLITCAGTLAAQAADRGRFPADQSLPLTFEQNRGQASKDVLFLSHGSGYALFLTKQEAVLALRPRGKDGGKSAALHLRLRGEQPQPRIFGETSLPGKSNYFLGNGPAKWLSNVPTFAKVKYENVYPGTDLVYYAGGRVLEYDFVVAPGADANQIRFDAYVTTGQGRRAPLSLDANGDLVAKTPDGDLRLRKPALYQTDTAHVRRRIDGQYMVRANHEIAFAIGHYDRSRPLVIDPALAYSSYIGGSVSRSVADGIATYTDSSGHVFAYVAGYTSSPDFPAVNAEQASGGGGEDAFVVKFDPSQSGAASIVFSTFLGGSGDDAGNGLAVDSSGNAYITGGTSSGNFPLANAYQSVLKLCSNCYPPEEDVFVSKLSSDGGALLYSTYFGGTNSDSADAIAIDASSRAYIAGTTNSPDLPTLNAYQSSLKNANSGDAFVAVFDATKVGAASLVYSTYFGGSSRNYPDTALAVAVDSSNTVHFGGFTTSSDFPVLNGFQTASLNPASGQAAAFYTRLNPWAPPAAQLLYSTYLGGNQDSVAGIALDSAGKAYLTGKAGPSYPTTPGAFERVGLDTVGGPAGAGGLVTKVDPTLAGSASLIYSTYIGNNSSGIAVDSSGNAYVAATVNTTAAPLLNPAQTYTGGFEGSLNGGSSWAGLSQGLLEDQVDGIAIDVSTSPHTFYAGAPFLGALFQSKNAGTTWAPANSGLATVFVNTVTVDPSNPLNVYLGTSGGVYKSADAAGSWAPLNSGLSSMALQGVGPITVDEGTVYAGAADGLYRLAPGATSWTQILQAADVQVITIDPTTSPHTLYTASTNSGAYKSADGGLTWTPIVPGNSSICALALDTSVSPPTVYAFDFLQDELGNPSLWKSVDRGASWTLLPGFIDPLQAGSPLLALTVDTSTSPGTLYIVSSALYKSTDGGNTFSASLWPYGNAITGIAVDTAAGSTPSPIYIATTGVANAYVAELNASGSALLFATDLGGVDGDTFGMGIALDGANNIYVAGRTIARWGFLTANGFQASAPFNPDTPVDNWGFFAKLGTAALPLNSGPVSTQVAVPSGNLSLTFPNVTGSTTGTSPTLSVAPLSSTDTSNFQLSDNLGAFEISTTALFTASPSQPVTLCFQIPSVNDPATFNSIQILHVVNGTPVNVANSYDFAARTVCGSVTSFSPFIVVKGPIPQIVDLIRMVSISDVHHGIQTSLDAKLQAAENGLTAGKQNDAGTACNQIGAFINSVAAQSGQQLTPSEAASFTAAAQEIKLVLHCSG